MLEARFLSLDDFGGAPWGALAAELRLPTSAREYLAERLPQFHLLVRGLEAEQVRTLRGLRDAVQTPGVELYPNLTLSDREKAHGVALLSGRLEQLDRLVRELGPSELGRTLGERLTARRNPRARWRVGAGLLPPRTAVMGIVNVTPDSFSDGGKFLDAQAAIDHGLALAAAGADLLDVGGESTRPGGGVYGQGMREVSVEEEIRRVVPVIAGLAQASKVPVSIDTRKSAVARAALDAGAQVINDVTALAHDPALASLAAERGASLCLMHAKGEFATMQVEPRYEDLLAEVTCTLADAAGQALAAGVARERIALDPGLGFGKTYDHNLALLRHLPALGALGYPVLVGASRKSFIGKLTGISAPAQRLHGSTAAAVVAALRGASVVRVHDVRETVEALAVADGVLGE